MLLLRVNKFMELLLKTYIWKSILIYFHQNLKFSQEMYFLFKHFKHDSWNSSEPKKSWFNGSRYGHLGAPCFIKLQHTSLYSRHYKRRDSLTSKSQVHRIEYSIFAPFTQRNEISPSSIVTWYFHDRFQPSDLHFIA